MQKVKSKRNKSIEQKLIHIFQEQHITSWRRNYPVRGKPDFVFSKLRIAVYADGCFWHGHHCRNITPKQNAVYWNEKQQRNITRNKKITQLFEQCGWTVLRFWECDIKRKTLDLSSLISRPAKEYPRKRACKAPAQ